MSQTDNSNSDSDLTEYRISLTDIRGVGSRTVEKLETIGVSSLEELHLCRGNRHRQMARRAEDRDATIGSDTWEHLAAVGKAVHYSGRPTVKAEHLTCSIASEKDGYQYVDITAQTPNTTDESEGEDIPEYSTERLQSALDRIHDEYDEGFGNQVSFEGDLARFIHESDIYNGDDHKLPQGIVQSVMRYRHNGEVVESQRDFEDHHKAVLVDFSDSLD